MSDTVNVVAFPAECRPRPSGRAGIEVAVDSAHFRQGMRRLAAGVSIVATEFEGARHGLVATSVSSVSADPPTLLVCVSHQASAHDAIVRAGHFSVNVLHADDRAVAEKFSTPALRARRFEFGQWQRLETGAPVLDSALAAFDCRLVEKARVASHTVFFGRIVAVRVREGVVDPLLFWDGAYQTGESGEV